MMFFNRSSNLTCFCCSIKEELEKYILEVKRLKNLQRQLHSLEKRFQWLLKEAGDVGEIIQKKKLVGIVSNDVCGGSSITRR